MMETYTITNCPTCSFKLKKLDDVKSITGKSLWECSHCQKFYDETVLFEYIDSEEIGTMEKLVVNFLEDTGLEEEDFEDQEELEEHAYEWLLECYRRELDTLNISLQDNGYILIKDSFFEYYDRALDTFLEDLEGLMDGKTKLVANRYSALSFIIEEEKHHKILAPLKWYGGKGNLKSKLLEYIPKHRHYVCVFGGAASLLFAKRPSELETYNDIHSGLYNFFKLLRTPEQTEKLIEALTLTPYSLEEFNVCTETWEQEKDPIEQARKFFVACNQSVNGNGGWSTTRNESSHYKARSVQKWHRKMANLIRVQQRLSTLQIDNRDFEVIFKSYDAADALFYCDPPYVPETRTQKKSYKHEMSVEDHGRLVDAILSIKGKVILSGYDNTIYDRLLNYGWRKILLTTCVKSSSSRKEIAAEYIWLNFDESGEKCSRNDKVEHYRQLSFC